MNLRIPLALAALLVIPGVAQAGCTAAGSGNPVYVDGSIRILAGIQCTTNNGSHYESRTYMQGDASAWHIVAGPSVKQWYSPANYFSRVDPYYFSCSALTPQDTYIRSKIVVENMVTHSLSIGYSGNLRRPDNCS